MDFTKQLSSIRERVAELQQIRDVLVQIEDTVCAIEKEVSDIDSKLPSDDEIDTMPEGKEKEDLLELIELDNEAFRLVDEILGPPEDELTGDPQGTAYSPEARGMKTISLDEVLSQMMNGNKGRTS